MPSDLAILIQDLLKSYGSLRALRGANLAVQPGQLFSFLGPNAAPVKSPPSAACLISLAPLLSGVFLVGNYLLVGLANIDADLKEIVRYTPAHFYQGGLAVNGLEWDWLAGVLAASLLLGLVTWLAFLKRDIRVGGEHGWKLILLRKKNKQY